MNRLLLILCFFATTLLSSCGFYEHRERIVLCKEIKATNDTLHQLTKDWHEELDRAIWTRNFATLTPVRIKLGQYISRRRSLIAGLEVPPDAVTLRESEGVFLLNRANVVTEVYPQFEAYADMTPEASVQRSLQVVARDMETETAWKMTIKKSMDAFAKKHGLRGLETK